MAPKQIELKKDSALTADEKKERDLDLANLEIELAQTMGIPFDPTGKPLNDFLDKLARILRYKAQKDGLQ